MPQEGRYSEASLLALAARVVPSGDERGERLDHFRDTLRLIEQRSQNRFRPEREVLPKAYLDGRFRIVLKVKLPGGAADECVLIQVESDLGGCDPAPASVGQFQMVNDAYVRRYDQLVVLVDSVEEVERVEVAAPSVVRLHLIEDEPLCTGESDLYRIDAGLGLYLSLPLMEWEHQVPFWQRQPDCLREKMIERRAQVVRHIADDQADLIWKWFGDVNPAVGDIGLRIVVKPQFVEVVGVGLDDRPQLINVAIGPLNL